MQVTRQAQIERRLRRIRSHPALWGELGPEKEAQAMRLRDRCRAILRPVWQERAREVEHQRGQRMLFLWQ